MRAKDNTQSEVFLYVRSKEIGANPACRHGAEIKRALKGEKKLVNRTTQNVKFVEVQGARRFDCNHNRSTVTHLPADNVYQIVVAEQTARHIVMQANLLI